LLPQLLLPSRTLRIRLERADRDYEKREAHGSRTKDAKAHL